MILKHRFDGCGLHLVAPVIDTLRALILRKIKDILVEKTFFKEVSGLKSGLVPADEPTDGLPGVFIEQEIQVEKDPFLVGQQIADIPAPPLIRAGNLRVRTGGRERPLCGW
jgi:hypothetical protein